MKKHFADVVINAPGDRKGVVKDKGGAWKERVTALTAAEGALRAVKPLGGAGPYVDVQCGDMCLGAMVCCVCVSVCVYIWMYVCRFSVGGYR